MFNSSVSSNAVYTRQNTHFHFLLSSLDIINNPKPNAEKRFVHFRFLFNKDNWHHAILNLFCRQNCRLGALC